MEPADTTYDNVYLEKIVNGVIEQVKVDKVRHFSGSELFTANLNVLYRNSLILPIVRIATSDMYCNDNSYQQFYAGSARRTGKFLQCMIDGVLYL